MNMHADCLFYDANEAVLVARQQNRVPVWGRVDGTQLCYYLSDDPRPEVLPNLVHLAPSTAVEALVESRLRLPTQVVLPRMISAVQAQEFNLAVNDLIGQVQRRRQARMEEAVRAISALPPANINRSGPLRVFAYANRATTVMQYCSRSMLQAFKNLGHEVKLEIESNDREGLSAMHVMMACLEFKPDIVFSVNHRVSHLCPPGSFQAIWWQDQMPPLLAGKPLPWRPLDHSWVVNDCPYVDQLVATGLSRKRIHRQEFCIDSSVFTDRGAEQRMPRVVFVGTAGARHIRPEYREVAQCFAESVESGRLPSRQDVEDVSSRFGVPSSGAWHDVLYAVVRDCVVRWLCRQRDVPVEIWGRGWEEYPEVSPFFRGEIAHGPDLASVYRSAKWALNAHSDLINHGRLAECAACGCIPLVYDCRRNALPPYWEDHALYFSNEHELRECLRSSIGTSPALFQEHFDYRHFANDVLAMVRSGS